MTKLGDYEVHPFADKFPLIEGEEFDALVADIHQNGLRDPITITHDHQVLVDGRNRYRACLKLGVKPKLHVLGHHYTGEQIADLIVSENVHRRHLTPSQRDVLGLDYIEEIKRIVDYREEKRKMAPLNPTKLADPDISDMTAASWRQGRSASAAMAAEKVQGSTRGVERAIAIQRDAPDLIPQIRAGEKTLHAADNERKQRLQQKKEESPPTPIVELTSPPPKKNTEEEKLKKKESERLLKEQRERLEDWTKRIAGQADALKISVFNAGLHPALTSKERQEYAQTLRNAKTKITQMINALEKVDG